MENIDVDFLNEEHLLAAAEAAKFLAEPFITGVPWIIFIQLHARYYMNGVWAFQTHFLITFREI